MLGGEHKGSQRFGGIGPEQHRHGRWTMIGPLSTRPARMHRAAVKSHAAAITTGVGVEATKGGQERGVYADEPIAPRRDEASPSSA